MHILKEKRGHLWEIEDQRQPASYKTNTIYFGPEQFQRSTGFSYLSVSVQKPVSQFNLQ